ncbi:hypothetical protein [Aurantimonas sp. HBX-1]|uniref:hypothetical protein n=1 Tax=Aurantimonas sp. HBX-1 TaxID=2906072 RepID=UPI00351CBBB9
MPAPDGSRDYITIGTEIFCVVPERFQPGLSLSLDPYMRGRMDDGDESHAAPYALGEPPGGGTVAGVISSDIDAFRSGDLVLANGGWQVRGLERVGPLRAAAGHGLPLTRSRHPRHDGIHRSMG